MDDSFIYITAEKNLSEQMIEIESYYFTETTDYSEIRFVVEHEFKISSATLVVFVPRDLEFNVAPNHLPF